MKPLLLFILCVFLSAGAVAQQPESIITDYKKTIKLVAKAKPEEVYSIAEKWFNTNPGIFTSKNASAPEPAKAKNKSAVEEAYDNHHPLQSLDPAAYRVIGQGLLKYYGGTTGSFKLLYVKYDIIIQATAGQVSYRVNNVRYFHFDPKNYTEAGIYAFKGGQPCDYTGTIEYLKGCSVKADEMNALATYFKDVVIKQQAAFTKELKDKKLLQAGTSSTAGKASSKSAGKTQAAQKPASVPAKK